MGLNGPHRLGLILVGIILLYVPSVVWLQQRVSVAHTPDAAGSVTLPVEAPQPDPVQKPRVVAVSRAKQVCLVPEPLAAWPDVFGTGMFSSRFALVPYGLMSQP